MAIAAVRFCLIDPFDSVGNTALARPGVIVSCAYLLYYLHRRLARAAGQGRLSVELVAAQFFYGATLLGVVAIFRFVSSSWISLALGLRG